MLVVIWPVERTQYEVVSVSITKCPNAVLQMDTWLARPPPIDSHGCSIPMPSARTPKGFINTDPEFPIDSIEWGYSVGEPSCFLEDVPGPTHEITMVVLIPPLCVMEGLIELGR